MRIAGIRISRILRAVLVAGALVFAAAGALADDHLRPPTVEEDIKTIPTEGEFAPVSDLLETCVYCHGLNSASREPGMPVLSGQHFYYSYVQLRDFAAGRRASEIMQPIAEFLDKEQMQLVAKFFAEQSWPNLGYRGEPGKVRRGEGAADAGACTACHLGNYVGYSRIPHVSGQQKEYLLKTMMDLKNDVRRNAAPMAALFRTYSDEDLEAIAEFLADY
jgi:cytochrome c553